MSNSRGYEGGAHHLARLHGTEEDKANCPFFYKVGSCRHTEKCLRNHERPAFSCTVLFPHMWPNPIEESKTKPTAPRKSKQEEDEEFKEFFVDVFEEMAKFGEVEDILICENLGEHMLGHVFVKFYDEEDAKKCVEGMKGRFFAGKALAPEFSPVSDFREAQCRQFDTRNCSRALMCNFAHIRLLPHHAEFLRSLKTKQPFAGARSSGLDHHRSRSRRRSRDRD
jgi:splicing factor U2AF subunit